MSLKETLTTLPQYLLPHHFLSSLMSRLTHCELTVWKNFMIKTVIRLYGVNMQEAAETDLNHFKSFNAFFTRKLKADVRPITADQNAIACPADGEVSQLGAIKQGKIFQAKGMEFSCLELLGGDQQTADLFKNGQFSTIYLSPKDYHRLHMPVTGKLTEMVHIPGRLFSVNQATANSVPRLFARNERVVCYFETEFGKMALILVGAIFVSSIETVWHGAVTPPTQTEIQRWHYDGGQIIEKGIEFARFNMGSTIIVLFENQAIQWQTALKAGSGVQLGENIADYQS